jgi:DHA2 family multidrug resistance protein-like MFS transporter
MTLIGFELVLSQRLQLVVGNSPLEAGAFVLPISLGSFFAGPLAGALIGRVGSVRVIAAGLAMTALGVLGYLFLRDADTWEQVLVLALCGMGIGSSLTASSTLVMSNVSEDRAGMAGSAEGVAYEFGGGFGVTIFGSIMTAVYVSTTQRQGLSQMAGSSLDEAHTYAQTHPDASQMLAGAMQAFEASFTWVSFVVAAMLLCLSFTVLAMRKRLPAR